MNDPICAVCGETRVSELRMYNYGVCLCHRCNEIAAHAFIKTHTDKKLKEEGEREDLRRCAICGKDVPFIHPNEVVINVDGKVVCPVCEKKVAKLHETAEEHRKPAGHTKEEEEAEKRLQELRERNAKAAEAAIKFALGTHEALMGKCSCCGKSVPRNELRRYRRGKYYEIFPATLCPTCFKEKNMERDLQVSDQALKNATRAFDDLKEEYESFRERTSRVWWGVAIAGVLIGSLFTLMFLNPR
ncbi:hypothetical protein BT61P2_00012 [Bacteroides phage BT61P2]|nr:hypothetical protein BT61P1_00011 [Bacteroides phage BT61P1]WAX09084.1 hypothetical protein BT61P2_00012 [Bacteroides phage BT61P2]